MGTKEFVSTGFLTLLLMFSFLNLLLVAEGSYLLAKPQNRIFNTPSNSTDSLTSKRTSAVENGSLTGNRSSGVDFMENIIDTILSECSSMVDDLLYNNTSADTDRHSPLSSETGRYETVSTEGRKKNNNMGMLAISAGTLLAVSLMGIGALAKKALLTSILALVLALLSMKGHEKGTTYEVHAKPIYAQEHTHSSELQHVHHGYK